MIVHIDSGNRGPKATHIGQIKGSEEHQGGVRHEMVDRCIAHGVLEHSFDNFHFKC